VAKLVRRRETLDDLMAAEMQGLGIRD